MIWTCILLGLAPQGPAPLEKLLIDGFDLKATALPALERKLGQATALTETSFEKVVRWKLHRGLTLEASLFPENEAVRWLGITHWSGSLQSALKANGLRTQFDDLQQFRWHISDRAVAEHLGTLGKVPRQRLTYHFLIRDHGRWVVAKFELEWTPGNQLSAIRQQSSWK